MMELLIYYRTLVTKTSKTGWDCDGKLLVLYAGSTPIRNGIDNGEITLNTKKNTSIQLQVFLRWKEFYAC
jgi:hypothetical protein